jgi:hypothetical protein
MRCEGGRDPAGAVNSRRLHGLPWAGDLFDFEPQSFHPDHLDAIAYLEHIGRRLSEPELSFQADRGQPSVYGPYRSRGMQQCLGSGRDPAHAWL